MISKLLHFNVITLMPEMFVALDHGLIGKAFKDGKVSRTLINPREFTSDTHKTVDDRPYGGGPGMVMMLEPLIKAIDFCNTKASTKKKKVIHLTPRGSLLDHKKITELLNFDELTIVSSRYEGVDERINNWIDEEISVGDYVTSGGDFPAMILIDCMVRQLPGVLNDEESIKQDSFANGLLDHPSYTRPEHFKEQGVPDVLISGDHEKIRLWRLKESLRLTWTKRPDLLAERLLTKEESRLLDEIQNEQEQDLHN